MATLTSEDWFTTDTTRFNPIFADVQNTARADGEKTSVIFKSRVWTYSQLQEEVDYLARALLAKGIRKGDRIATLSTPRPEFLISYLAATSIGAIWQGINPRYTERELEHVLGDALPSLVFVLSSDSEPDLIGILQSTLDTNGLDIPLVIFGDAESNKQVSRAHSRYEDFLETGESIEDELLLSARAEISPENAAILVYTSGTTGLPKGALVRHSGLSRLAHVQSFRWQVHQPRIIVNQPINHISCVGDLCSVVLHAGGTLVFTEHFEPRQTLELIATHNISALFQVPTQLQLLATHEDFTRSNLSSLQVIGWGGGTLSEKLIDTYRKRGIGMQNTYGLTEVASSVTYSRPGASTEDLYNSVGEPDPQLDIRFLNEGGEWGPSTGPGEICVKHPTVMIGYLNRDKETSEAFTSDGWLRTGDIGELDEKGNLRLIGRCHEMIKSGGYNVYPKEIEQVLDALPGVVASAVVERKDERFGQVGVAFVQGASALNENEVKAAARAELANYKIPKEIYFEELPHLANHKVDKQLLRSRAAHYYQRRTSGSEGHHG